VKTISVCRAQDLGSRTVEPVKLMIGPPFSSGGSLQDTRCHFARDAALVHEALLALPQGTRHRLLVLLLQDHEVLYIGAQPEGG